MRSDRRAWLPARVGAAARAVWPELRRGPVLAGLVVIGAAMLTLMKIADDVSERDGVTRSDPSLLGDVIRHRATAVVDAAKAFSIVGSVGVLVVVALFASIVLWWKRLPLGLAVLPMVCLGAGGALAAVGKSVFDRPRPPLADRLVAENAPSFPSGHATDSAAVSISVGLLVAVLVARRFSARCGVLLAAVGLTIAIALSRLVLGVHWPSDVVAGLALGTTVAVAVVGGGLLLMRHASLAWFGAPGTLWHRLVRPLTLRRGA